MNARVKSRWSSGRWSNARLRALSLPVPTYSDADCTWRSALEQPLLLMLSRRRGESPKEGVALTRLPKVSFARSLPPDDDDDHYDSYCRETTLIRSFPPP